MIGEPNTLFSGMQPSADSLHLGNYAGALLQWIAMQDAHDAVFCIVDLHAITVSHDPRTLAANTRKTAAQYMACGIDPQKSIIFVQSHVPAHSELAWILNTVTSFGEASRMTQFKTKSQTRGSDYASVGLFTYPILQAADILLYNAKTVPVGEDQRQHIELTRNIAERFNQRFGETFIVPEAKTMSETAKIYDLQIPESKMSKSSNSQQGIVWLLDEPETINRKIQSAVTDSGVEIRFDVENKPGVSNLLRLASLSTGKPVSALEKEFEGSGYGTFKKAVAEAVVELLRPIRTAARELIGDPAELDRMLTVGASRAEEIANVTLARAREALGFLHRA